MKITAKSRVDSDSYSNGGYVNALSSLGDHTAKILNKQHYKHIGITHQGSEDIILTPN